MGINAIHILEITPKEFPTDSDKIRQTKAEQVITPQKSSQLILSRFSIEKHLLK